jgi:hypothetical protein
MAIEWSEKQGWIGSHRTEHATRRTADIEASRLERLISKNGQMPWVFEHTVAYDEQTERWVVEGVARKVRGGG